MAIPSCANGCSAASPMISSQGACFRPDGARSGPAQILLCEWKRADPLAGDLEDRLRHGGREMRTGFLAHSRDPFVVGLQELDVDLRRGICPSGGPLGVVIGLPQPPAVC